MYHRGKAKETAVHEALVLVAGDHTSGALGVGSRVNEKTGSLLPLKLKSPLTQAVSDVVSDLYDEEEDAKSGSNLIYVKQFDVGFNFSMIVSRDPSMLYASGSNKFYQLSITDSKRYMINQDANTIFLNDDFVRSDSVVMSMTNVKDLPQMSGILLKVICGYQCCFLYSSDRNWFVCGRNACGEVGLPNSTAIITKFTCVPLLKSVDIIDVFTSKYGRFSFFLSSKGVVYAAGSNTMGQLGAHIDDLGVLREVCELSDKDITQISCGAGFSVFLSANGDIYGCGASESGQLGTISNLVSIPTKLSFSHGPVASVSCGCNHTMIVNTAGELYATGRNNRGALGLSHMFSPVPNFTKVFIQGIVKSVSCGGEFSIIQTTDNRFFGAGENTSGSLGLNHYVTWSKPVQIRHKVIEYWRRKGFAIHVGCGMSHTVFCANVSTSMEIANHFLRGLSSDQAFHDMDIVSQSMF